MEDGAHCFCGQTADVQSANAKARSVDKAQCVASACRGDPSEPECGAPGRLLAFAYSCDDGPAGTN